MADAPLCLAIGIMVGLTVWFSSVNTFASEGDVQSVNRQITALDAKTSAQYQAILIKIELSTQEKIIQDAEQFIASSRRELVQLRLEEYEGDVRAMVNGRISELNNEIETAQRNIQQAQRRILELQGRQDRLTAQGLELID